jgi:hypothetical protein
VIARSRQREFAMAIIENTPRRLVLGSGSTKLTLDKDAGRGSLQRKILFWNLKPTELPLSDFSSVTLDKVIDRASGVEIFYTMLITRAGAAWAFPADDKADADKNMARIREFLDLPP